MTLRYCSHEKEVAELLSRGQWPQACAPELRAHISACRACGDLVLVTETFQRARADEAGAMIVTSPGALWWRAQLRRRNAAIEHVGRPLLGSQLFALAILLVLAAGFMVSQLRPGLPGLTWLEGLPLAHGLHLEVLWPSALFNSGWSLLALIPVLATLALLGGVALYLA